MKQSIVLRAEYDPELMLFDVSMMVRDRIYQEHMSIERYRTFCSDLGGRTATLGGFVLLLHTYTKRNQRGILNYFRGVLRRFEDNKA